MIISVEINELLKGCKSARVGKERRGEKEEVKGLQPFVKGCTCPSTTCPTASQHQEIQQLTQSVPEREGGGLDWISFLLSRDPLGKEGEKEGCELISQYIVSCHFYRAQHVQTDTRFPPCEQSRSC